MSSSKTGKDSSKKAGRKGKNRAAEIANTFEWLITAFVLAFVFRAFVMEAFRIPTGSMADTLKGAHARLRCPQCGYRYDYGFVPEKYNLPPDTIPRVIPRPTDCRCPSCGWYQSIGQTTPVANGDRILVLKCIYQFFDPKRWDVIVFKDPLDPTINYIKRLAGLPDERLKIIDGDIYINGEISRKPRKVQNELWMPVYDNDYQPVRPKEPFFNDHRWQQPFKNIAESKWITTDPNNLTIFRLDSAADQINTMIYDTSRGNDFRGTYAYDDVREYEDMPYCSDLMVRFYADSSDPQSRIGIELSKYQTHYKAWVDFTGEMVITKVSEGKETILDNEPIAPPTINRPILVKFANVDHRLVFQFGSEKLTYDLGPGPDGAGQREPDIPPEVGIFGCGKLTLSHVAIFRDIHYTARSLNRGDFGRATEGNPVQAHITLGKNEFFVLGDNSPNSQDSRWWAEKGIGINGRPLYREGIVPRDYLVGKALFVYWPSGFKLFSKSRFAVVPNVGQMRFIYGGSSQNP